MTGSPPPSHLWPSIDHLFITDKKLTCTINLPFFDDKPNQLITKDQLFSLSIEQIVAEFFKYFDKLDEAKDYVAKHRYINSTLLCTLNIKPPTWNAFCNKYNLWDTPFNAEKFVSIN